MGTNPFIDAAAPPPPTKPYTLTLENTGQQLQVDPADLPDDHDGQVGSVLSLFLHHDISIDHACGGVVACSTCHIYVKQGLDTSPEPIEEEEDMLDMAPAVRENSRLACQFVPDGSEDVVVEIPAWNRNLVKESDL